MNPPRIRRDAVHHPSHHISDVLRGNLMGSENLFPRGIENHGSVRTHAEGAKRQLPDDGERPPCGASCGQDKRRPSSNHTANCRRQPRGDAFGARDKSPIDVRGDEQGRRGTAGEVNSVGKPRTGVAHPLRSAGVDIHDGVYFSAVRLDESASSAVSASWSSKRFTTYLRTSATPSSSTEEVTQDASRIRSRSAFPMVIPAPT